MRPAVSLAEPILVLTGVALLAQACNQSEGSGFIEGELTVPECQGMEGGFSMDLDFFAVEPFGDRGAMVRLQRGGRGLDEREGLVLHVYDVDRVRDLRAEAIEVQPFDPVVAKAGGYLGCERVPREGCPLVRAELNLVRSCPKDVPAFELTGEVVFNYFGIHPNERTAGSFELLVWSRTDHVELGELGGRFEFLVRQGHPYQRFPR